MTTPSAVDAALAYADLSATETDAELARRFPNAVNRLAVLAAEVRRLQGSEKLARIAQHELQDEVDRCNEELDRLRQPVSDAAPQEPLNFVDALKVADELLRRPVSGYRKTVADLIDGTPYSNDLTVRIAETLVRYAAHQPAPVAEPLPDEVREALNHVPDCSPEYARTEGSFRIYKVIVEALRDTRHAGDAATVRQVIAERVATLLSEKEGFYYLDFMGECAVPPRNADATTPWNTP